MSKKKTEKFPAYMLFEDDARRHCEEKYRKKYLEGLHKLDRIGINDTGVDTAFISTFLAERIAEFREGRVSAYEYPIWKTIGYLLSFKMEYYYDFIDWEGKEDYTVERDICSVSEYLPEVEAQKAVASDVKRYLTAAAALALQISSPTLDGWRELLVQVEFGGRFCSMIFDEVNSFVKFERKMQKLIRFLWADVEIFSAKSIYTTNTPIT